VFTRGQLKEIAADAPIFKMSLGKGARYRREALDGGNLIFQSEKRLFDAVMNDDAAEIRAAGRLIRNSTYPQGDAKAAAVDVWARSIRTFTTLPERTLVIHWEGTLDRLQWGLTGNGYELVRTEENEYGQVGYIFHRPLIGGWRTDSIGGVPLSNIHPAARSLAINQATINLVRTDTDYFRALILDAPTSVWEERSTWREEARQSGWHPKLRAGLLEARRRKAITADVVDIADQFEEDIRRMAGTAVATARNANGQLVLTTVKAKDIGFAREELEDEIADLLRLQRGICSLTGFAFVKRHANPHLRPSLDRIDSSRGYVRGNLQVVTRAANFYKSASDDADWKLKEEALLTMARSLRGRQATEA